MFDPYGPDPEWWCLCPQCGEPTEKFPDGVCSDCSIANEQELDNHLEEYESWSKLNEREKDRLIREKLIYVEHYTEPDDDEDSDAISEESDYPSS